MTSEPSPENEPRISITYSPAIDASRDLYDSDTIVITVLDEDFEGHEGRGVPLIALEKGRHEYPDWIRPLVQKHCEELLRSGRMHIEAVVMDGAMDGPATQVTTPIAAHSSPYIGTAFSEVTTPVSQLKSLMLIPEELRMDAVGLLCTELEGAALLHHLKLWGRDPFLKPGVKTRLTKLIRKMESESV
jgi:hypothetical protein